MARKDKRRNFTQSQKTEILLQQGHACARCGKDLRDPRIAKFDHIDPWADGGRTVVSNGQALCADCHSIKDHDDRFERVEPQERGYPQGPDPRDIFGFNPFGPEPKRKAGRSKREPPSIGDMLAFNPLEPNTKKGKGRNRRPPSLFDI